MKKEWALMLSFGILFFCMNFISAQSSCSGQTCNLYLGDTLTISGQQVSLSYLSGNQAIFNIGGTSSLPLVPGSYSNIVHGIQITLNSLTYQNFAGGSQFATFSYSITNQTSSSFVSSCSGFICVLNYGDSLDISGKQVSLNSLSGTRAIFNIGGTSSSQLDIGGFYSVNGLQITLNSIIYQNYAGGVQSVNFTYSTTTSSPQSSCSAQICTLYLGDTLLISSKQVSLSSLSGTLATFNIEGENPLQLGIGTYSTTNDLGINLTNIVFQDYAGGSKFATFTYSATTTPTQSSSCSGQICTLYQDQSLTISGKVIQVGLSSGNLAVFNIGGTNSLPLNVGGSDSVNGIQITLNSITFQDYAGGSKFATFTYSATTTPTQSSSCSGQICTLYQDQSLTISGKVIQVGLSSGNLAVFNIGGTNSLPLNVGGSDSVNGIQITLNSITFQDYAGGSKFATFTYSATNMSAQSSSCSGSTCTLNYGDILTLQGKQVSLSYLSSTQATFNIDGTSSSLAIGSYSNTNGLGITLTNIIYQDYAGGVKDITFNYEISESAVSTEISNPKENTICGGCKLEDKCYDYGYRKNGDFCSDNGNFTTQLSSDVVCENNFECSSNICAGAKCISQSFLQSIINWFKSLFGIS